MKNILFLLLFFNLKSAQAHLNLGAVIGLGKTKKSQEETFKANSQEKHQMQLLNSGIGSLEKRLRIIEGAKKTIDVEYFIYKLDRAGRLFSQALVRKAEQGVKVRLLVDATFAAFRLKEKYAHAFMKKGIEVRYYNREFPLLAVTMQHRDHRKMIVVDGHDLNHRQAIVGGRNIGEEYFDLSDSYNFMDRDLWVRGPIVNSIQGSFEAYWNSEIVSPPKPIFKPQREDYIENGDSIFSEAELRDMYHGALSIYKQNIRKGEDFIAPNNEDLDLLQQVRAVGSRELSQEKIYSCNHAVFLSDKPGIGKDTRVIKPEFQDLNSYVAEELIIENPYFVPRKFFKKSLRPLLKNGKKITLLTNSLKSSDAIPIVAIFNQSVASWVRLGMEAFIMRGGVLEDKELVEPKAAEARWGTHSKTFVMDPEDSDENSFVIGTYNLDPRSTNINSEVMLGCIGNRDLTLALVRNIEKRKRGSVQINERGETIDGSSIFQGASATSKILYYLSFPFNAFSFLY